VEKQRAKRMKNRKDDYALKKGFGETKKKESEEKEGIMVGGIKYGKGSLRIWGIRIWGYEEEIRRFERIDGGEGGGRKNDKWRRLQRKNREKGRVKKKRKKGKGIRRIARNKEGQMLAKRIRERGLMIRMAE